MERCRGIGMYVYVNSHISRIRKLSGSDRGKSNKEVRNEFQILPQETVGGTVMNKEAPAEVLSL